VARGRRGNCFCRGGNGNWRDMGVREVEGNEEWAEEEEEEVEEVEERSREMVKRERGGFGYAALPRPTRETRTGLARKLSQSRTSRHAVITLYISAGNADLNPIPRIILVQIRT